MQELKRLRKDKNWSQVRLAKESGVDRATINQVEGGHRSPTIETLEKLALAMGTEVADFFPKVGPSLLDAGEQRRPEWFEALQGQIMDRAVMYGEEAEDENSPHFKNATVATLWLERVADELAMWADFSLTQVGPFLPRRRFSGWKAIGDVGVWGPWFDAIGPLVIFDAAVRDGERRIKAMNDKPDEIATRRLEKAAAAAGESRKRFEELLAVNE